MLKPRILVSSVLMLVSVTLSPVASFADLPGLDKSPADIAYFRKSRQDAPVAKLIYSRPQKSGRVIFGDLVPYGKVWRTGANENTEINFYRDVKLAGKPVKAGRYSLYTIPGEKSWTIVLNSALDVWGASNYDQTKDVLRVDVPVSETKSTIEAFTMQFVGEPPSGKLLLVWDNVWVEVPVSF